LTGGATIPNGFRVLYCLDFNLRPSRDRNWQLLNSGEPLPTVSKKPVSVREVLPGPFQVDRIITKKCPVEVRL
jgi:hypothetical protein